jgi:hypothetical protein
LSVRCKRAVGGVRIGFQSLDLDEHVVLRRSCPHSGQVGENRTVGIAERETRRCVWTLQAVWEAVAAFRGRTVRGRTFAVGDRGTEKDRTQREAVVS